jgi:hypothetical protein
MEETKTLAQEAFELLSPIPAENWIMGEFTDGVSKCCGIGHYMRLRSRNPDDYSRSNCDDFELVGNCDLRNISLKFLSEKYGTEYENLATVNNSGSVNGYKEDNPKDRVLHLLRDMIEAGY